MKYLPNLHNPSLEIDVYLRNASHMGCLADILGFHGQKWSGLWGTSWSVCHQRYLSWNFLTLSVFSSLDLVCVGLFRGNERTKEVLKDILVCLTE